MNQPGKSITILLADDDADDRMLAQEALEEARLTNPLHFVEDGEQLLDYLNRRGEYEALHHEPLPGLILLDLNMPKKAKIATLSRVITSFHNKKRVTT